jgi:hypothetical protein
VVRIKKNLGLILGGLTKYSKENQRVWRIEWDHKEIIECEPLEKGDSDAFLFFRWSDRTGNISRQ